jgi:chemotaxis protein CheD
MLRSQNNRIGKVLYLLYPGDHFASRDDCYIGTIAGSCLVVCLFDYVKKTGGMINFVVPGTDVTRGILKDDIFRTGILNMEYLMADMVKLGCDRHHMKAKIFGAGYSGNSDSNQISSSENNIKFVTEYFSFEKIPIEKKDLGGNFRRKIYFSPADGTVYRKILQNNEDFSEFITLEKEYVEDEFRNRDKTGKILLFD